MSASISTAKITEIKEASIINIANGVTLVGIGLTLWLIEMRCYGLANQITFLVTLIVALTDYIDGYLARKYDQETRLGSGLDRVRDKLYAIPHFYFIYDSFQRVQGDNISIYLVLALLIFIFLLETVLLSAGIWGWIKKLEVSSNRWGKYKMLFECFVLFSWAFVNDLKPYGCKLIDTAAIYCILFFLASSIFLAWKSLEGYHASYFGSSKGLQ
jgi:phosphatidylglycerophosphate synthase